MGHSPRGNKTLPVFYGGQYPVIRGTIPRTRSPGQSPTRKGFGHHHSGSRMHVLRVLVLLGMGLLAMSLMYVQVRLQALIIARLLWQQEACLLPQLDILAVK